MLTDYFEPFSLLEKNAAPDGLGGESVSWQYLLTFRGALTHTAGRAIAIGGQAALRAEPVLLYEFDVTLRPGDHVRRERDGSVWRVGGCTAEMRTPAFSGLQFAQAPVERVVIPC